MFSHLKLTQKKEREKALSIFCDGYIEYGKVVLQNEKEFEVLAELAEFDNSILENIDFNSLRDKWNDETQFIEILDELIRELELTEKHENLINVLEEIKEVDINYIDFLREGKFIEDIMALGYDFNMWIKEEQKRRSFEYAMKFEQENKDIMESIGLQN